MKRMITEFDKLINQESDALKDGDKIRKKSTLMNASRCAIYEYLCHQPCSSVSGIANGLKISESRVRWHLDKLVSENFVIVKEDGNAIFFPSKMIRPEHIDIFKLLAMKRAGAIHALIRSKEGICQSELCKELDLNTRTVMKYAFDLENLNLIRGADDGKYRRYYLTNLMGDLKDYYRKNARNFKEYIVKKTKRDGLRPEILLSTPELLRLKLVVGGKRRVLTISMIPFDGGTHGLRNMGKERYMQKKGLMSPPSSRI